MAVPTITLTATLEDFTGTIVGSAALPSALQISLCGFGQTLPVIIGTCNICKPGPFVIQTNNGLINTKLWGNDVISPSNTYYAIAVLDERQNVLQTGIYQFSGTETIDLSNAIQLFVAPAFPFFADDIVPTSLGGFTYTVPQAPAPPTSLHLYKNGVLQMLGYDYTLSGNFITYTALSAPVLGDTQVADYRYAGGPPGLVAPAYADDITPTGTINGINTVFTLPSAPNPSLSLQLYLNGILITQGIDYTLVGVTITYFLAPKVGYLHVAFYRH